MTHPLHILADRVEGLRGPCRETDALIWLATQPFPQRAYDQRNGMSPRGSEPLSRIEFAKNGFAPAYTASLDAALSLVPVDHEWSVTWAGNSVAEVTALPDGPTSRGHAETPALALTAASLRTIAANQESE